MAQHKNTVLITGGASGIGLGLAERYLGAGHEVIICGRRRHKLDEAKEKFPHLHTRVCDITDQSARLDLFRWVTENFPDMNVLVNNAGIQQRVNLNNVKEDWDYYNQEIASNLAAPIHLTMLFIPHLKKQKDAQIINISSGLSIAPGAWVPIYSATKAALHSFTLSLRLQLETTNVQVVEVLPPAVNTDLGGVGLHTFGAPLDDFSDKVYQRIEQGDLEIGYGGTEERLGASRDEIEQMTRTSWEGFVKRNPDF